MGRRGQNRNNAAPEPTRFPARGVSRRPAKRASSPGALKSALRPLIRTKPLARVQWKQLNARYRNDYDRTLEDVMQRASDNGYDPTAIREAAGAVLEAVRALAPRKGQQRRPPRAKSK